MRILDHNNRKDNQELSKRFLTLLEEWEHQKPLVSPYLILDEILLAYMQNMQTEDIPQEQAKENALFIRQLRDLFRDSEL